VPEEVKQERRARLMELQAAISSARLRAKVGRRLQVLVDEVDRKGAIARSSADAPEIDGVVRVRDGAGLRPGDFAEVMVEQAGEHDLAARLAA